MPSAHRIRILSLSESIAILEAAYFTRVAGRTPIVTVSNLLTYARLYSRGETIQEAA